MTRTKRALIGCVVALAIVALVSRGHKHRYRAGRPLLYASGVVMTLHCTYANCHDEVRSRPVPYDEVSMTLDAHGCPVTRTYLDGHEIASRYGIEAIARLVVLERTIAAARIGSRDLVPHG